MKKLIWISIHPINPLINSIIAGMVIAICLGMYFRPFSSWGNSTPLTKLNTARAAQKPASVQSDPRAALPQTEQEQPSYGDLQIIVDKLEEKAGSYICRPQDVDETIQLKVQLEEVVKTLEHAWETVPGTSELAFLLARTHSMQYNLDVPGSIEKTVKWARKAAELSPPDNRQEPHLFMGAFFCNAGYPENAIWHYWEALWQGTPGTPVPPSLLGGLATGYLYMNSGLWAHACLVQLEEDSSLTPPLDTMKTTAAGMVRQSVLEAITMRFDREGIYYENTDLGHSFTIPPGWHLMRDGHQGDDTDSTTDLLTFSLPGISDRKGNDVESYITFVIERTVNEDEARHEAGNLLEEFRGNYQSSTVIDDNSFSFRDEDRGTYYFGLIESSNSGAYHYRIILTASTTDKTLGIQDTDYHTWRSSLRFSE